MYVPNPNGHLIRGWCLFDVGATSLRRFDVEMTSLLCCARWDSLDMSTEELRVNNCYHNDVLPTPTRAKVTSTCCPKDSDVEMSLTHRYLSKTGDTLYSMLLKSDAFCENNKSA